ncbi:hypothetical protein DFJ74DRAFT_697106 [Hyaloraphidium curvatum]|nr:hypothetical protein DFJ74DRAFT_697106 [Hyaloraphidium curvatum]
MRDATLPWKIAVVALVLVVGIRGLPAGPTTAPPEHVRGPAPPRPRRGGPGCASPPRFLDAVLKADAILNEQQRIWIAATINAAATHPAPLNVLIFGCGKDSGAWWEAMCSASVGSELLFLETDRAWINRTADAFPQLAGAVLHFDGYSSTLATKAAFFAAPDASQLNAKLPEAVTSRCWDVVLIDAPPGIWGHDFGRHEAAHWTAEHVLSCFARGDGERDPVVFIHDLQRGSERDAFEQLILARGAEKLGELPGPGGLLGGAVFRRPHSADVRNDR